MKKSKITPNVQPIAKCEYEFNNDPKSEFYIPDNEVKYAFFYEYSRESQRIKDWVKQLHDKNPEPNEYYGFYRNVNMERADVITWLEQMGANMKLANVITWLEQMGHFFKPDCFPSNPWTQSKFVSKVKIPDDFKPNGGYLPRRFCPFDAGFEDAMHYYHCPPDKEPKNIKSILLELAMANDTDQRFLSPRQSLFCFAIDWTRPNAELLKKLKSMLNDERPERFAKHKVFEFQQVSLTDTILKPRPITTLEWLGVLRRYNALRPYRPSAEVWNDFKSLYDANLSDAKIKKYEGYIRHAKAILNWFEGSELDVKYLEK